MADIFVGELVNVIAFGSVESVLEEEISTKYEIKKKNNINIYEITVPVKW